MNSAASSQPGGLLFDIDGTLAHTDAFHHIAFNQMLEPFGITISEAEYLVRVMGRTNAAIMADFFPDAGEAEHLARAEHKEALFRQNVRAHVVPMPGLMALLDWTEDNNIPKAVVTNAPRLNANLLLDALNLTHRFGAIVIGDELPHGKPHPLPYLEGASRLGLDASMCVAFEDSRSGVTSAARAGAYVFGITSSLPVDQLIAAGAHEGIADFSDARLRETILGKTGRTRPGLPA